jgi:hypothetical protein
LCGGNETINLKTIFSQMNSKLENGEKLFNRFYLNNTAISELAENTFENITFDVIEIRNAKNLSLIHTNAFTAMNVRLKEFLVFYTSLRNSPPNYDIFKAMSLMIEIETIYITYSKLEDIPENAFQPLSGQQNKLKTINFDHNIINSIGNNAFQYLSSLSELILYGNKIDHIPSNALRILNNSGINELHLGSNLLNSSSFEKGSLNYLTGPVNLQLSENHFVYLDQNIFEIFFNSNEKNKINVYNIDCEDCRSFWLFKNKKFINQTEDIYCLNGKRFAEITNFKKCPEL